MNAETKNFNSKLEYYSSVGLVFEKGLLIPSANIRPIIWDEIKAAFIKKEKVIELNFILLFVFLMLTTLFFLIDIKMFYFKAFYVLVLATSFVSIFLYKKYNYQLVVKTNTSLDSIVVDLDEKNIGKAKKLLKEVSKKKHELKKTRSEKE